MLQPISTLKATAPEPPAQGSGRVLNPLRSLRRHGILAAGVFAAVLLAGVPYAWVKGKAVWRAEGVLYVSPRFLSNLESGQEQELQSNTQYREFMQQQIRTVNRFDILRGVLGKAGMMAAWKKAGETDRHATERLQSALQIASVPDTYQVTVGLQGEKAEGLAELVNAVMSDFTEVARRELIWDAEGRLSKLNDEKASLEAEIAGLAERKSGLASRLGTTVFNDAVINSYDRRLAAALDALEDARRQRFAAETALTGQAAPGVAANAMDKAMGDAALSSLRGELSRRKAVLLTTIEGLSPQHTGRIAAEKEIRDIDAQIDRLTAQAHDRWQSGLQDINQSRYEQAKQLEGKIQKEVDQLRGQAESFSRGYQSTMDVGDEIARVRRRLSATEDRINFLMLETAAPGFVRVFSQAMKPEEPVQGGRKKLLLVVLLAALLLAVAVPVGIDMLDRRILTARELEAAGGMPVSGELSGLGGARRLAVVIRRHRGHLSRKALVLTPLSENGDAEGAAIAAARELKRLGLRPLVVDASISGDRPQQRGMDGNQDVADLTRYVERGVGDEADRIVGGVLREHQLLPADPLLRAIEVSPHYDIALIVSAPVTRSLAAEELVRTAGAVLLVVTAARDTKAELKEAIALLSRLGPGAFGMLLQHAAGAPNPAANVEQGNNEDDASALLAA